MGYINLFDQAKHNKEAKMRSLVIGLTVLAITFCFGYNLLTEDFNSNWTPNSPPTGWRIFHTDTTVQGTDDWHRQDSVTSPWITRSTPYAAIFWNLNADAPPDSLISPTINCNGYHNIKLHCTTLFNRILPNPYIAQLRYSVDGGATFPYLIKDYHELNVDSVEEVFSLDSARKQPGVVIAWVFDGNLSDIKWWCIDDVVVEGDSIPEYDIACTRIQDPNYTIMPGLVNPRARFSNHGLQDQLNVPVACSLYDNTTMTPLQEWYDTIPVLNSGQTQSVTFAPPYNFAIPGKEYYIKFWCLADSDYNRSNDTLDRTFQVTYVENLSYCSDSSSHFVSWPVGHYGWGVKLHVPPPNPVYLESAKVYLNCPANPSQRRYQLAVVKVGPGGEPGEVYFKTPVLTGTSGWNSVFLADTGEQLVITSDSFYLFYLQVGEPPECPELGIDGYLNHPGTYWQYRAGTFQPDTPPGDYMIRASINHEALTLPLIDIRTLFVDEPLYEFVQRPFDAPLIPTAVVENSGTTPFPSMNIPVTCSIVGQTSGLCYTGNVLAVPPLPGQTQTITFPPWVPTLAERCSIIVSVNVVDSVPQNNSKKFTTDIIKGVHTGKSPLGYAWTDSDTTDGPTFDWVTPDTNKVCIAYGDEMRIFVPIGFQFPYYDTAYEYCYVCTNGWMSLGDDPGVYESLPGKLPDIRPPNRCLYPWWDNLAVGREFGRGKVYFKNLGTWPNRSFVVIWKDVNRIGTDTNNLITFETILHEDGTIVFQYNDATTGDLNFDNGRYSCIGTENSPGTDGLCYLYARPPMSTATNDLANRLTTGRAIKFSKLFHDAAALDIVVPEEYVFPGEITPEVKVQNHGSMRDTLWAYLMINPGGYADTVMVPDLPPGDSTIVSFKSWTCSLGNYAAFCSTAIRGDAVDSNNVCSKIIIVSSWVQREDIPYGWRRRRIKGSALCYVPTQHKLYALKGSNTNEFWVFDIATGVWDTLAEMPKPPSNRRAKYGCDLAYDPDHGSAGYLWAIKGGGSTDFYAYDIGADEWTFLNPVTGDSLKPVFFKNLLNYRAPRKGAAIVYAPDYGTHGAIYCIPGHNTNHFWRYDIAANIWEVPFDPNGPIYVPYDLGGRYKRCRYGADLEYGAGEIYCLKGSNSFESYGYSISRNAWVDTVDKISLRGHRNKKVKSGGSMTYMDNTIYILKGGNTQEFWGYDLGDTLKWVQRADIPISIRGRRRKVKRGSSLAGTDSTIFCLKGSYSSEFWEYKPSSDSAGLALKRPLRQGIMARQLELEGAPMLAVYPNPTRSGLGIHYSLNTPAFTRIKVYNPAGEIVRTLVNSPVLPGRHATRWDGLDNTYRRVPGGVYFIKLESGTLTMTRKLIIQR